MPVKATVSDEVRTKCKVKGTTEQAKSHVLEKTLRTTSGSGIQQSRAQ